MLGGYNIQRSEGMAANCNRRVPGFRQSLECFAVIGRIAEMRRVLLQLFTTLLVVVFLPVLLLALCRAVRSKGCADRQSVSSLNSEIFDTKSDKHQ